MDMTDESTMRLYALAVVATRTVDEQQVIGVQSALALIPEATPVQDIGQQAARDIFPESDGWEHHYVTATEVTQGFPLKPYHLTWQIESGE